MRPFVVDRREVVEGGLSMVGGEKSRDSGEYRLYKFD